MSDPFRPTTTHTINPLDPRHPLLFIHDDDQTSHIKALTIFTEGPSGKICSEVIKFLDHLHSLEKFVIHWRALDWVMLGEPEIRALVRLFSLPSLHELQILASANFPLCLLQYYAGKQLSIAATTLATAVTPVFPSDTEARRLGALTELALLSASNIREFRTFIEWQAGKAHTSLRSVKCLRCSVSWGDEGAKPEESLKDIGSLLQRIGPICRDLEEFRLLDWQNSTFTPVHSSTRLMSAPQIDSFDGYQFTQADLASLTSLKRLYVQLGASPKADEKTMNSMDASLRHWLLPLLSNILSPQLLERIDITFSFVVPFPWPTDLHNWMRSFAAELDVGLTHKFPTLRTANLTFDLRNAHTMPYDWQAFNDGIQPTNLQARGVACAFRAAVYRPY
ncbi:hypothetical protein P691DRAFT_807733 [Macrolepiota fuliginosa MF-IS2]|uniref:Uncharacterized protein n=1 Tax=Macrolepiota fuliginosa MF-IS2 TaxID=1400762 RepID=A0A9P5X6Q9_9AGAR|nr:hypothetical protein P691DRAFT_807733 [Macrolepiota fuliginosa MF-IS2]